MILFLLTLGLTLFSGSPTPGQAIAPLGQRQLYLLAGTPSLHGRSDYPATLYELSSDKKLKFVREVVSRDSRLHLVRAHGDVIFVVYPHPASTTVSIIHAADPTRPDEVPFTHSPHPIRPGDIAFSKQGVFVDDFATVVSVSPDSSLDLLIPWITDSSVPAQLRGTLASVSSRQTGSDPRVKFDTWQEYAALRWEGIPGGPALDSNILGSPVSDKLTISLFGHDIILDSLPPSLRGPDRKNSLSIVAASELYLLLAVLPTPQQLTSGSLPEFTELFVHDRVKDRWRTSHIDGNLSASRLFGNWLVTRVQIANPSSKPNPGKENQRGLNPAGRPNIQEQYDQLARLDHLWLPGTLILENLADGRKIRIQTGQADSEILWVGPDVFLYRVNDTIFQAKIVGDQIRDTTLVVKDDDVPEIHWVFWSR
jgi:hypothetical protein